MDFRFDIKSSWKCENIKNLASAIKTVDNFSENIFEILTEDQCVSFKQPVGSLECSISIELIEPRQNNLSSGNSDQLCNCEVTSNVCHTHDENHFSKINTKSTIPAESHYLDKIIILSEARFIELYSKQYSEYITTVNSTLLSEFEDSKMYQTTLLLDKSEKSVVFKPKGLFCHDSVWIYGIFIKVKMVKVENNGAENPLEMILREKNVVLSEKAEKFKKLLNVYKSFQNTNTYQPFIDPFSASSVFSNIQWAYGNNAEEKNLKFLHPKSQISTNLKEQESSQSNENQAGGTGTMEKLFTKMQQLIVEENNSKSVNGSHLMKLLSRNGNAPPPNHCVQNSGNFTETNTNSSTYSNPRENEENYPMPPKSQPLNADTLSIINSVIDKKLKQFEDHIVNILESKIDEANKSIIERLDKIENLVLNNPSSQLN